MDCNLPNKSRAASCQMQRVAQSEDRSQTEGFMRTLKEELLWLEEFAGLDEAREKLWAWIDFYNNRCLHSALGYKSPQEYEQLYRETNREKAA